MSDGESPQPNVTSAGAERSGANGAEVITTPRNALRDVLLPIFLVVLCALIIELIASWGLVNCNAYIMIILSYSLLFGAGGMVLGGALRVQGQLKSIGGPWTIDAAGGIAAALVAGFVAYSMKPACSFDSKIQITDLPLREPDSNGPVRTFVTVETDSNVIIQRGMTRGTLNFNFDDSQTIAITMRAYQQDGQQYRFLAACEVQFVSKSDMPEETKEDAVYWLKEDSPLSFSFDVQYFKLLADADRNSTVENVKNTCLKGLLKSSGASLEPATVVTPLHVVREKIADVGPRRGRLGAFFTKRKLSSLPDTKAALKEVAQTSVSPSNEILTSSGTGSPARLDTAPIVKDGNPPAQPLPAIPPPGCPKDAATGVLVDSFLNGDDLDKKTRQEQIYSNWSNINCYVLPIAVGLAPGVSSLQQSRALKLLINAIMNNSLIPADQYYWQSDGTNRRDFRKPLPYLQDVDLQRIFALISSDDALIRAEALRFVKLLPVDGLEHLFKQKLQHLKTMPNDQREPIEAIERFAVAGVSLYYNRIVEWLDGNADPTTRAAINVDFSAGMDWASDSYFNGRSAKPYEATLLYAKGIVEREQKLTDANGPLYKATFARMLARLKLTEDTYPLRQLHIAQALAFVTIPDASLTDVLRQIQQADQLTPAVALDDSSPFTGKSPLIYAGPKKDPSAALGTSATTKDGENLLLHLGDWYFVRGNGKIGWITRS